MWVLIVFQVMAGSSTASSSLPINYSGVVMQEFQSRETCEKAAALVQSFKTKASGAELTYRNGIISAQCVQK